jgi:hypothetical protein
MGQPQPSCLEGVLHSIHHFTEEGGGWRAPPFLPRFSFQDHCLASSFVLRFLTLALNIYHMLWFG